MKSATVKQKQLLHVLPARLRMSDEERRAFLSARTGKRSAAALSHREATLVIDLLMAMVNREPPPTCRVDGATRWELEKLASLRSALGEARFDGLARRLTHGRTADPREMTGREARATLQAARSILEREGTTATASNAEAAENDGEQGEQQNGGEP